MKSIKETHNQSQDMSVVDQPIHEHYQSYVDIPAPFTTNNGDQRNTNKNSHWQELISPYIFPETSDQSTSPQTPNRNRNNNIHTNHSNQRSIFSIKGGTRPEEDDYDQSGESSSTSNNYWTSASPLSNRGRPEPTYGIKDLLHSPIAWSTNEIIIVSLLSLFVLIVIIIAIVSEVKRRKRVRKRRKILHPATHGTNNRRGSTGGVIGDAGPGDRHKWEEEALGNYELDIEDPAYWGGGLGVANEMRGGGGMSWRQGSSDSGMGSASGGVAVPVGKLSKDYKLAAMDMFNSRIEPGGFGKPNYGF